MFHVMLPDFVISVFKFISVSVHERESLKLRFEIIDSLHQKTMGTIAISILQIIINKDKIYKNV